MITPGGPLLPENAGGQLTTCLGVMLTTCLGSLLLSGVTKVTPWHAAVFSLLAAGMMSGCSAVILLESMSGGLSAMVPGFLLGLLAMRLLEFLPCEELDIGAVNLKGDKARRVVVLFCSLFVHSAGEGLCLGASAAAENRPTVGHLVTASIALHNVPEGLAVTMAFMSRGLPWRTSAVMAVLCNLSQPVVSVLTYNAVVGSAVVNTGLAFAAACMLWIVCFDLVPESLEHKTITRAKAASLLAASAGVIMSTDQLAHIYAPR